MNRIESQQPRLVPVTTLAPTVLPFNLSGAANEGAETSALSEDAVSFSDEAVLRSQTTAPRFHLISRIRDEINAGAFETPQRIEGTVDRLLDILGYVP
ncbi:MAG: hypothetical protein KJ057_07680 [Phycisphaerae bacterium]|nr:MAG: hypothetical protein F9K17_01830 [Phycisphaerae bacterium]MBE7456972.1 hypothetical protein [Planctomycetia bacterium]MCQ3920355.1 hypothetical protein [Planctomycetota bacterium]MCK6463669.1 hypothetical protein [Phycisphaerae bacterium]MCL4718338.1 hypothetical protein [Phycisphaerae bacterium]